MEQGSTRWFQSRKFKWGVVLLLIFVAASAVYIKAFGPDSDLEGEAARIATVLDLKAGMAVGEVGAGNGKMAVLLARQSGSGGHLFATEIDADNLDDIRERVVDAGLDTVTVIEAGKKETNLAPECCDAIFMRKVYHHFTDPAEINASLFEALRRGGVLAVIDFSPSLWNVWLPRPDGVPENRGGHGMPKDLLIAELTSAGFQLEQVRDEWWRWPVDGYCVVVRKPKETTSESPPRSSFLDREGAPVPGG